jgi:hypothetical protein
MRYEKQIRTSLAFLIVGAATAIAIGLILAN